MFPVFLTKKCTEKIWFHECAPFLKFGENSAEIRLRFLKYAHIAHILCRRSANAPLNVYSLVTLKIFSRKIFTQTRICIVQKH